MCKRILKEETSESGDIPFYKISTFGGIADAFISKDIFEKYRETYSYPKIGDILISAAGTLGKTVIFDGKPSYFQDSNIVWVDNDEKTVINSFLYYFYQTNPWIKTTGSTINRLYNNDIKNLEISFPDLIKQQSIAAIPIRFGQKNRPEQTNQRALGRDGENPVRLLVRAVRLPRRQRQALQILRRRHGV